MDVVVDGDVDDDVASRMLREIGSGVLLFSYRRYRYIDLW
jgi:hypothetical protein